MRVPIKESRTICHVQAEARRLPGRSSCLVRLRISFGSSFVPHPNKSFSPTHATFTHNPENGLTNALHVLNANSQREHSPISSPASAKTTVPRRQGKPLTKTHHEKIPQRRITKLNTILSPRQPSQDFEQHGLRRLSSAYDVRASGGSLALDSTSQNFRMSESQQDLAGCDRSIADAAEEDVPAFGCKVRSGRTRSEHF